MNDLRIFTDSQFGELRTVMLEGEPWFVAADVCAALGIDANATRRLDDDEKNTLRLNQRIPGNPNVTILNEAGLYSMILRSRKQEARAFRRWITHEVLPSIRKRGAYITSNTLDEILGNPEFGIRLLTELKSERDQRLELETQNREQQCRLLDMQSKVSYFDHVLQNEDLVPISVIAKDYGLSAEAMNTILHKLGVQYKVDKHWVLYQRYAGHSYAHSYTEVLKGGKVIMYTRWTQKGRLFIYDQLKKNLGMVPQMEREAQCG